MWCLFSRHGRSRGLRSVKRLDELDFYHAVYGGFFIFLSYAWGWAVDKERPDAGEHLSLML